MISSEVQRTLVKSPPELWSELSDPESLARHLGELGELGDVTITRTVPEQLVEWRAAGTTGRVQIKASGWGTKVTLSVTRETLPSVDPERETEPDGSVSSVESHAPEPLETPTPEPVEPHQPELETNPERETEPNGSLSSVETPSPEPAETYTPEPVETREPAVQTTPAPVTEAARRAAGWPATHSDEPPEPVSEAPEPRRGFFARLFGGKRKVESQHPQPEPDYPSESETPADWASAQPQGPPWVTESAQAGLPQPTAVDPPTPSPEPAVMSEPVGEGGAGLGAEPTDVEPSQEVADEQAPDLAAELQAAEEVAAEEVRAALAAVLDRLGAAHHRPFSRS